MAPVLEGSPVSRRDRTRGAGQAGPSLFCAPMFDSPCLLLLSSPRLPWPRLGVSLFPSQLCCLILTTARMQACFYSLNVVLSFCPRVLQTLG